MKTIIRAVPYEGLALMVKHLGTRKNNKSIITWVVVC